MKIKRQVVVNVRELSEREKQARKDKCQEFAELMFEMNMTIALLSMLTDITVSTIYRWTTDTPPPLWAWKYVRAIKDVPELREHLNNNRRRRIKRYGKAAITEENRVNRQ